MFAYFYFFNNIFLLFRFMEASYNISQNRRDFRIFNLFCFLYINMHNGSRDYHCNAIQDIDKNVEHCADCDVCIIGNDHHCPWSSKCVGYKNINMFKLFICSLFLHIFYLTFAAIFAAINANQQRLKAK